MLRDPRSGRSQRPDNERREESNRTGYKTERASHRNPESQDNERNLSRDEKTEEHWKSSPKFLQPDTLIIHHFCPRQVNRDTVPAFFLLRNRQKTDTVTHHTFHQRLDAFHCSYSFQYDCDFQSDRVTSSNG